MMLVYTICGLKPFGVLHDNITFTLDDLLWMNIELAW